MLRSIHLQVSKNRNMEQQQNGAKSQSDKLCAAEMFER